jgi:hypothetical protein
MALQPRRRSGSATVLSSAIPGVSICSERGLIVRLRSKDRDDSDTTVKYRRPEPIDLPAGWREPDAHPNYKIEGDWTGDNHQVSASLDSTLAHTVIDDAVTKGTPLERQLFSADQRRFASAIAAPYKVNLCVTKRSRPDPGVAVAGTSRPDLGEELGAEQWIADDLIFLELSIRVKYGDGKARQHRFADWAKHQGVARSALATTKTQAVLEHFAKRRGAGAGASTEARYLAVQPATVPSPDSFT